MKKLFLVFFLLLQASCVDTNEISLELSEGGVNFSEIVDGKWSRFCVLRPYSDNNDAHSLLGFHWDLENRSQVSNLDSIALLLFATDEQVIKYTEISRDIDFSMFGNACIERSESKFRIRKGEVRYIGSQK